MCIYRQTRVETMTKQDRQEYDARLKSLDYWQGLAIRNAVEQRVMTKKEALKEMRNNH